MRLRPTLFVVVGPARSVRAGSAIFVAMVALVALVGLLAGGCRKERNWAACALPDDGCKRGFQCIEQRCVADGELDADVVGAPGDAGVDRAPGGEIDVGPDPRSCTSDDECSRKSPAAPTCQNGTCEACKGNEGCAGRPERPICDGKTGRCVGCVAVADCSKDPEKPVCAGNVCVPCNQAAPGACMATTRAMCAPSTGRCVDCQSPKDCVGKAGPLCVAGQCVKCNAMGVPATACEEQVPGRAVCDATLGCVECAAAKPCTDEKEPICRDGTCFACATDTECAMRGGNAGICLAGRCVGTGEAIYVQNVPATCATSGAGAGSSMRPFCNLQDALKEVSSTRRVLVLRGPQELAGATIAASGGPIAIVGQNDPIIYPGTVPGLHVTSGDLYVRGIRIRGSATTGVIAEGPGTTFRLERCIIENNRRGGLQVIGASFEVSNTVFVGNYPGAVGPSSFGGAYLGAPPTGGFGIFRYNTIVGNMSVGVACERLSQTVSSLLLHQNLSENVVNCTPLTSREGVDPRFDPARPYRLTKDSPCVDYVVDAEPPSHDVDGEVRPKGTSMPKKSDCGADEL